jgi:SAM-dependent methyltransferase
VLDGVGKYYSGKVRTYGASPQGVDWNGPEGQELRFSQLMTVANEATSFTLAELGCGYGALVDHLVANGRATAYHGVDVSPDMVAAAQARHADVRWAEFEVADRFAAPSDFCVASGIFNVRLDAGEAQWLDHIHAVIDLMNDAGTRGFAFNALTSYSDAEKMRGDLYYANPLDLFDRCKRLYSRDVALLHDYGLWEFTIVVRKR